MTSGNPTPLIYLMAGEASGDVIGARLMAAITAVRPGTRYAGVGGPRMAELGFDSLYPMSDLAVMGIVEVIPRIRRLRRRLRQNLADIAAQAPDVVVTIDSPGFMHWLLESLAKRGVPRIHYVAPQVWAWRAHRVKRYPGLWNRLLCLLPFEPAWFAQHGLDAQFVGHPVLESGAGQGNAARFRATHNLQANQPILILMPGSRRSEVPRLLPVFGRTLERLAVHETSLRPVVPVSAAVADTVRRMTAGWPVQPIIVTDLQDKHDAYAAAAAGPGAALTKSGTSTLELALAGVPMAVTYRVNAISAAMARRMITVPHVAMVNLLAGRAVVPELLQQDCTAEKLSRTVLTLLRDPAIGAAQRAAFGEVMASLAPPNMRPSEAAALEVLGVLDGLTSTNGTGSGAALARAPFRFHRRA